MTVTQDVQPWCACQRLPATVKWSEHGALGMIHGFGEQICEACSLERQIKHAEERAAILPHLKAELAKVLTLARP